MKNEKCMEFRWAEGAGGAVTKVVATWALPSYYKRWGVRCEGCLIINPIISIWGCFLYNIIRLWMNQLGFLLSSRWFCFHSDKTIQTLWHFPQLHLAGFVRLPRGMRMRWLTSWSSRSRLASLGARRPKQRRIKRNAVIMNNKENIALPEQSVQDWFLCSCMHLKWKKCCFSANYQRWKEKECARQCTLLKGTAHGCFGGMAL